MVHVLSSWYCVKGWSENDWAKIYYQLEVIAAVPYRGFKTQPLLPTYIKARRTPPSATGLLSHQEKYWVTSVRSLGLPTACTRAGWVMKVVEGQLSTLPSFAYSSARTVGGSKCEQITARESRYSHCIVLREKCDLQQNCQQVLILG